MRTLWFDSETFSECDLFTAGTPRYAEHPSTEIIVVQWALDDGEPRVHDLTADPSWPDELIEPLADPDVIVVAHNSFFDRTVLRDAAELDVPIERWRDTMVKALCHGLPGGLDKVGQALGVAADVAKDKRGRELIQLFCKPRPKNHKLRRATRHTHPKEWTEFLEYSRQDIVAMRAIDAKLPNWNYREGGPELALWHLDQRINDRGFAVDTELAEAAVRAVALEQARLKRETSDATSGLVTAPSQRDALLAYILAEHGVSLPDMKADTLRRRVEDPNLPDGVRLLLSIRLEALKVSTAKYKALLRAVTTDGRLHATMQFAGAQRTARWAHRLFQPGNMPRPTPDFDEEQQDLGVAALKADIADLVFGDVMQLTANAVRGCIVAPPFKKLCIADLSNIEGRGLVHLAGERWKIKAFEAVDRGEGADLYKLAYARAFNVDVESIEKWQRQIGKVMELGLGYEGGVAAFLTFAAVYNMDLKELADAVWAAASEEQLDAARGMLEWFKGAGLTRAGLDDHTWIACEVLVLGWREAHPAVKALWGAARDAFALAAEHPGVVYKAGKHLQFRRDGSWLRMRLPSGRYLCYLNPEVKRDENGKIKTMTYLGVDQYTKQWKRISTYGGKLIENATQAFARDVLAYNMPAVDAAGYKIVLSVHDELITETPDAEEYSSDELAKMMSRVPHWAPGLPLSAAGFETTRYRKE